MKNRKARFGIRNGKAILTYEKVRQIRSLLKQGLSQQQIADRYHVSRSNIAQIATGRIWKEVSHE